jgi:RHS repeat-associated protein
VVASYLYDGFGDLLASAGTVVNPLHYRSGWFDTTQGTYSFGVRVYTPAQDRFLSVDPFGGHRSDPVTLHRYLYAGADPIQNVDPSGKEFFGAMLGAIGDGLTRLSQAASAVQPVLLRTTVLLIEFGLAETGIGILASLAGWNDLANFSFKVAGWSFTFAGVTALVYWLSVGTEQLSSSGAWYARSWGSGPTAPQGEITSLHDVAEIMRANLPPNMSPQTFGHEVMRWGSGSDEARARISTLTAQELRDAGVTADMANWWARAYEAVARISPDNPSAAGRAELMRRAAELLRGS